jgi:hypothetical protein
VHLLEVDVDKLVINLTQVTLFTRTGVGSKEHQGRYAAITRVTAYADDPSDSDYENFQEQSAPSGGSRDSLCYI